jgi:hypothetical protein
MMSSSFGLAGFFYHILLSFRFFPGLRAMGGEFASCMDKRNAAGYKRKVLNAFPGRPGLPKSFAPGVSDLCAK